MCPMLKLSTREIQLLPKEKFFYGTTGKRVSSYTTHLPTFSKFINFFFSMLQNESLEVDIMGASCNG